MFPFLTDTAVIAPPRSLPPLHVVGPDLVNPAGQKVVLRGANLGNWLIVEFWMLGLSSKAPAPGDQYDLEALLTKRFGEAEKDRLMDVYRESWITDRDLANFKKFDFNLVRLPMNYRLMEDDRHPFQLKPNAWRWIDRAVDMAEQHGLYVILDMHGAQGGQNAYDHSGHAGQNHLKDNFEDQQRLAWLWSKIAERYRNRSAVVAYDALNEPYGMPKDAQVKVFKMAYASIRKMDPEKLIFAHGNYDGFEHYGSPVKNGWHNVGLQMHYYPGLFGGGTPSIPTHRRHLDQLEQVAAQVKPLNVPFYIGEMNVVFASAGGADMMRRYFDFDRNQGWLTTMWAYKVLTPAGGIGADNWGAVTNANPQPPVDFNNDTKTKIEGYFRHFATEPLAVNEKLARALSTPDYKPAPLPLGPPKRIAAPQEELTGWQQTDVGGALKGGLAKLPDGSFELYGGGADIWNQRDQFRFLYQVVEGDFTLEATLNEVQELEPYTKGGLMVRSSLEKDSATALLSSFPTAELQFAIRSKAGADISAGETKQGKVPGLRLRITRKGDLVTGSFLDVNGAWTTVGTWKSHLPSKLYVGAVALSHDETQLAKIVYRDLDLKSRSR